MTEPDAHLSELARTAAEKLGVVGAQLAVLHHGVLRQGVSGITHAATGTTVEADTIFQIGSTSKVYAAALLLQHEAAGRVELDRPVATQLPSFRIPDEAATQTLTPRHLLSMSSGLDNGSYHDYGDGDDAPAHYVAELGDKPLNFAPGTGYGYSNASTVVTGLLTQHVGGASWERQCADNLLRPAGLGQTTVDKPPLADPATAWGHDPTGDPMTHWLHNRSMAASGGVMCASAGDLVRFGHLFLHDGLSLAGTQVLPPGVAARMHAREVNVPPTNFADWWGLGPYGRTWDGLDVLGHSGTFAAGSSYLLWAPAADLAIATTVNVAGLGYPFARACFEVLFPELAGVRVPPPPTPRPDVTFDAELLVGTYEMTGVTIGISGDSDGLFASWSGGYLEPEDVPPTALLPLSPTTFLPTHPVFDGRRGWAIAFMDTTSGRASYLVNGSFALRRTR